MDLEGKKRKMQIIIIRNEIRNDIIDLTVIKRVEKEYDEQLYSNKFENLNGLDRFLKRHKLKSDSQRNKHLNHSIFINEIKFIT